MADLLVMRLEGERFSWGRANLQNVGEVRHRYIAALASPENLKISSISEEEKQRRLDALTKGMKESIAKLPPVH